MHMVVAPGFERSGEMDEARIGVRREQLLFSDAQLGCRPAKKKRLLRIPHWVTRPPAAVECRIQSFLMPRTQPLGISVEIIDYALGNLLRSPFLHVQ